MTSAYHIFVRGVVQGVGFRPFIYRLAHMHDLTGWVLNDGEGVEIWIEGDETRLEHFLNDLKTNSPSAARVSSLKVNSVSPEGFHNFTIKQSHHSDQPTTRISPDLTICDACLRELRDPNNRRYQYPYINCTNCGPRYSIITALPYDRPNTTMKDWPLCAACQTDYDDPLDRRFHAQPVACPACGPNYILKKAGEEKGEGGKALISPIPETVRLLREGVIVAIKGLGGYHLACDARKPKIINALRERKFRKEKPFAVMVKDVGVARALVTVSEEAERLLTSVARPIVLLPKKIELEGVAPDNRDLGVMLPYTPLHQLLYDAGAPDVLVMTSANRSSEPIAFEDNEALTTLGGIADAFLIGERPIARRTDDSVVKPTPFGVTVLRRARGYAPGAVTNFPKGDPILAVGADLKNAVTLVVEGQAFVSQHVGDLEHYGAFRAFQETISDLTRMYGVKLEHTLIAHDAHPSYRSTQYALALPSRKHLAVQHHRAHIAAVLAEKEAWGTRVLGIAFDGTGYGDDGAIWGGEFFMGSLKEGFERVGHLRYAKLPGGDAAAKYPVQAAAGVLTDMDVPDLSTPPFNFPNRYLKALELIEKNVQVFPTSSVGRLFDTVAALLGFTREMSFEGQAAMWLEYLATGVNTDDAYLTSYQDRILDYRPMLTAIITDRVRGKNKGEIARAFHAGLVKGILVGATSLKKTKAFEAIVISGGVFQNSLLQSMMTRAFSDLGLALWTSQAVPVNDGGISLGQAAIASFPKCLDRTQAWHVRH